MILKKHLMFLIALLFIGLGSPQAGTYTDEDCLQCHGKPELSQITQEGKTRSLFVDGILWKQDVHKKKGMSCTDCHVYANPFIHFREGHIDVNCARCHPEEEEEYLKNIHFRFNPQTVTSGKELPQCYHCHTRHQVLRHDHPLSSVHEDNVGDTCGSCHAEVMVTGVLNGFSPGKISGHRKGDLGEKFDMNVCISCHYEDSAHGNKRVYKVFCVRCHDPASKGNMLMGGTHINSSRWSGLNIAAVVLVLLFFLGLLIFQGYRSSGKIMAGLRAFLESMKKEDETTPTEPEPGEQSQE
jgi:hypothetical protein